VTREKQQGGPRLGPGRPRKYDPANLVRVLLQLPADLGHRLDARAARLGISRTEAIQEAIRAWLKR
jgi:hypothetical protein